MNDRETDANIQVPVSSDMLVARKMAVPNEMAVPSKMVIPSQSPTPTESDRHQQSGPALLKTPKGYLLAVLLFLTAFAAGGTHDPRTLLPAGAAVASAVLVDLLLAFVLRRKRLVPDGALLTGLIVGLVLSTSMSWYQAAATAAIAIVSKHVLKVRKKPIFNPAAFGLLAAILLFGTEESWWGGLAEMPTWCIAVLIIGGYVVAARVNKFPQAFAFLGVHYLLWLILDICNIAAVGDLFRTPFINSALFLAFFMVTDPPTSPGKYRSQVIFSTIAAVASVANYLWLHDLGYLLTGLLAANVCNAIRVLASPSSAKRNI